MTERLHANEALLIETCAWEADEALAERMAEAFLKVHRGAEALKHWQAEKLGAA